MVFFLHRKVGSSLCPGPYGGYNKANDPVCGILRGYVCFLHVWTLVVWVSAQCTRNHGSHLTAFRKILHWGVGRLCDRHRIPAPPRFQEPV